MLRRKRQQADLGLAHFAAGSNVDAYLAALAPGGEEVDRIVHVPLRELIAASWQPRIYEDPAHMAELTQSIQRNGLIHPITVRSFNPPTDALRLYKYEVVAGHRRLEALTRLAHERGDVETATVPVRIKALGDLEARLLTYAENAARKDLAAWEKARVIASTRDTLAAADARCDVDAVCKYVGRSAGGVSQYLRIADVVTVDALRAAGVCDADGRLDVALVHRMQHDSLVEIVKAPEHAQPAALRALADKLREAARPCAAPPRHRRGAVQRNSIPDGPRPARYTYADLRERGGFRMNLSRPFAQFAHDEAQLYLGDLLPAVAALGEVVAAGAPCLVASAGPGVVLYVCNATADETWPATREAALRFLDELRARIEGTPPGPDVAGRPALP